MISKKLKEVGSSGDDFGLNNGLNRQENQRLFYSRDEMEIVSLILRGLKNFANSMKDLRQLLKKSLEDFAKIQPTFQEKKEKVEKIQNIKDFESLNGEKNTYRRLDQLSINPNNKPPGLERLLGKNNLMDISYFRKGLEVADRVCRIVYIQEYTKLAVGTGFLVGPGLLMTNNHVIESPQDGEFLQAEFEFEKHKTGINQNTYFFELNPEAFFITNKALDYTIIGVEPIASNDPGKELKDYGWNKLTPSKIKVIEGEALTIIQHPKGLPKMIAFRENKIISLHGDLIHYTTDTQEGSSGSLVANDNWEIVALHRSGVPVTDDKGNIRTKNGIWQGPEDNAFIIWKANQGVLIDSILKDIVRKNPDWRSDKLKSELLKHYYPEVPSEGYQLPKRLT